MPDPVTPGRIVHYVLPTGEHRPALVITGEGRCAELEVWYSLQDGPQLRTRQAWVAQDEQFKTPDSWHYPERS